MLKKLLSRREKVSKELDKLADRFKKGRKSFDSPVEKKEDFQVVETFFSLNNPNSSLNRYLDEIKNEHNGFHERLTKLEEKMEIEKLERERTLDLISNYHKELLENGFSKNSGDELASNFDDITKISEDYDFNRDVGEELHFITKDGNIIRSLNDLVMSLKGMRSDVFSHHVTENKNDFASWINDVHKNEELAADIIKMNRLEMIEHISRQFGK